MKPSAPEPRTLRHGARARGALVALSVALGAAGLLAEACATAGGDLADDVPEAGPGTDSPVRDAGGRPRPDALAPLEGGDEDADVEDDAASDAGPSDGSLDAARDAAPDAARDAAADASPDAATDAGRDAAPDAAVDAGPLPSQGDVLITEVMFNPTGNDEPATEWLEVLNASQAPQRLTGLTLKDGSDRVHTIGGDVTLAPGQYAVLAYNRTSALAALVPAGAVVYEYGTQGPAQQRIQLANSDKGAVYLTAPGGVEIAQARYIALGVGASGASAQLKTLTYADSKLAAAWCTSGTAWIATSDKGTPGAASDCP